MVQHSQNNKHKSNKMKKKIYMYMWYFTAEEKTFGKTKKDPYQ